MLLFRLAITLVLAASTGLTAARLHRAEQRPYDLEVLPRPALLRLGSLGHPTLAANLYWLKVVQYIGEPQATARGWDKLHPALELVTDLDPAHGYAYQVGGIILGSVGRVQESNAILEKGMRNIPNRYILPFLRAFNAFYYDNDFARAGHFVEIAANTPGAPAHLRQTALAFYVKGREADAAIGFLSRLRAEARDPETAKALDEQLKQAHLEKRAQQLEDAIARYRDLYGVTPATLDLLVAGGVLTEIPPDPYGGSFVLGGDGRVRSSVNPFRFKPPGEIERHAEPGVTPESGYPGATMR